MGEEKCIEDLGQEEVRSLGKMLQGLVRDTVRACSLGDLKTLDGFVNLFRVRQLRFVGKGQEVKSQHHVNHLINCRDRRIGHRLKLSLQTVGKGFGFIQSVRERFPGVTRDRWNRKSQQPFGHPPQRLVFGIECRIPLVVSPLFEPAGHRPLQVVDLGFQRGVPGDLPSPTQPVLQAYHIMNGSRYRRLWVVTRAKLCNTRR